MDEAERCAVGAAQLVRVMKAGARLDRDAGGDAQLCDPVRIAHARDHAGRGNAIRARHRGEVVAAVAAELVNLAHVRMIEARDELALVEEHPHVIVGGGERRMQALDDDDLLEPGFTREPRQVDLRHAAGREPAEQLVATQPGRCGRFSSAGDHGATSCRNVDAAASVSLGMAAMPYFHVGSWDVFGLPLIGFGVIAACGVTIGGAVMRRYGEARGVTADEIRGLFSWVFIGGIAGAHLFDLFVYQHADVSRDPLRLIKFWDGISSYGGFIGGALAFAVFIRLKRLPARLLADVTMVGLLPAFSISRIGCTVVSDHVGAAADPTAWYALLAEHYPRPEAAMNSGIAELYRANPGAGDDLIAWNLGFIELLYLIPVNALILWLAFRRRLNTGFIAALAGLVYAPVRFFLDYLRPEASDPRYADLTFPQGCSNAATALATYAAIRIWRRGAPVDVTVRLEPAIALR